LYSSYRMSESDAKASLTALGVPDTQITELLAIWAIERGPETRLPTISELAKAVQYQALDPATAITKAEMLGYTAYDAYIIMSGIAEAPLNVTPIPTDTDSGVNV
jgi:hypothetical protein